VLDPCFDSKLNFLQPDFFVAGDLNLIGYTGMAPFSFVLDENSIEVLLNKSFPTQILENCPYLGNETKYTMSFAVQEWSTSVNYGEVSTSAVDVLSVTTGPTLIFDPGNLSTSTVFPSEQSFQIEFHAVKIAVAAEPQYEPSVLILGPITTKVYGS